jgi:hypothetical protein
MSTQFQGGFVDWSWMSDGDLLLSGGDIYATDPTTLASIQDMVGTRLKASLTGWQLYTIGADLQARLGDTISNELNLTLRRQINQSLTNQFLPRGSFTVQGIVDNGMIQLFVYVNQSLIATASLNPATGESIIS